MAQPILAPSCAWAEPKQRSRSSTKMTFTNTSQLRSMILAMNLPQKKLGTRRSSEQALKEQVCMINADAEIETRNCSMIKDHVLFPASKLCVSDDDISTKSGGSRGSNSDSVEELFSLPGSVEDISMPSRIPGKPELKSELSLREVAIMLAERAQSQFSGRVYQDVRNAFLAVDTDSDGKLTPAEAQAFCQHFGLPPAITSRFFSLLDRRETGLADWSSFLSMYAPVFNRMGDFKRNASKGRKWPALR